MKEYEWNIQTNWAEDMTAKNAKEERKTILQRTIPQQIKCDQAGYASRQGNFGYRNEVYVTPSGTTKKVIVPHESEAVFIRMIFDLAEQ